MAKVRAPKETARAGAGAARRRPSIPKPAVLPRALTGSLLVMGTVLVAVTTLAWADDPVPMFGDYVVKVPDFVISGRGAYKIAENESPSPQDRIFVNYNYYNGVPGHVNGRLRDVNREFIGFEKTFLADWSIGARLPFIQETNNYFRLEGGSTSAITDLSLILKYALINNRENGNTLSLGLVATPPTGSRPRSFFGPAGIALHPTLLQPFVGYRWGQADLYVHAFHSVLVPTDSRDVTVLFNDFGVGYWVYRGSSQQFITGVVPTVEVHVNTPLDHRSAGDLPRYRDSVHLTGGVHVELERQAWLGIAVGAPVTSPGLFKFEVIANLNMRF